jgi:IS30 family transposase
MNIFKAPPTLPGHLPSVSVAAMRIFNGLLRQCIPKKRSMSTVTDEEIKMIQNRLNNRPKKRLGFKITAEVFHQKLKRVELRA